MIRSWKCLLGAWAVCAIAGQVGYSQEIVIDELGVARVKPSSTTPRPADVLYSDSETVWTNDFQPPPGVGVDPVTVPQDAAGVGYAVTGDVGEILYRINRVNRHFMGLDDDGYTSAGALIPAQVFDGGNAIFAFDPRAFVSDSGAGGLNFGVTFRRYAPSLERVFVFSQWLDYDRTGQVGYAQYGVHAAAIGKYWALRGNINLPVGQSHEFYDRAFSGVEFQENFLVLTNQAKVETAYQRFDAEFSLPIPYFARYGFEFGVGAYYLNGAFRGVEDSPGLSARFETQVTEDIWANALMTQDDVFGSNMSVNFEVTLPNGPPSRMFRRLPVKQYLVQSDKRTYRVIRGIENRPEREIAISTSADFGGDPIFIAHVDPNAAAGGDGTFENPFNSINQLESLADAAQDDYELILVRGRNDNTDTNLNTTLTLFDGQRLLGDGVTHSVDATQGTFLLTGFGTPTPLLTNSADDTLDVVRLASRNEVSGFDIDASGTARAINGLNGGAGISGFNINRNSIDNTSTGVELDVTGTDDGFFEDNSVTGAVFDGVVLGISGGNFDMPDGIVDNVVTGNGRNGFVITNLLGGTLDVSGIADNDFSDNGAASFLVNGNGDLVGAFLTLGLGDVEDNDFSRLTSGTIGFEFDTENVLTTAVFQSNDFTSDSTANTDANRGVGGRAGGFGGVNLTFGPIANTFSSPEGNTDAHIGLVLDDDTDNVINISNHDFSDVINGTNALFNGEGVSLLVQSRADLSGSVTSSTFEDNAGDGLRVAVNGTSFPLFSRLTDFAVGGPNVADGNVFRSNGGDGLAFIRTGNGQMGSFSSILIQNNLFEENDGNGYRIDSSGTDLFRDQYTVLNNRSLDNLLSGLQIFVRADALLNVDMDQNLFDGNGVDGVSVNEQVNNASDNRSLEGVWTRNEFTNNLRHGIQLNSSMGDSPNSLLIGDLADDNLGNLIAFNANDGIDMGGTSFVTISRNIIAENGRSNADTAGTGDNDAGIDIHSATFLNARILDNAIINNLGDGIEILSDGVNSVNIDIEGNFIAYNDGRGLDLLVQPESGLTDIDFHDNIVNENGEEGVYIVYTSSTTQTQDGASTDALLADGDFDEGGQFLRFDMTGNQVLANGRLSNLQATGLVVRVGTIAGGYGFTSSGGFASNGVSVDSGFTNSGVIMRVADNQFGGNFGDDVWFHSFVSTVDPTTTAGTWTDVDFEVDEFEGDPLARLDLHWDNNTFDSIDANNSAGVVTANPLLAAFYENDEAVFKSRDINQTDPGPFTLGTRRRNAQRLAARIPFFTAPATPGGLSDLFLYSGIGQSTFRVRGGDAAGDGFLLDAFPYVDTGDANGFLLPGAASNGELGYGWTFLP